VRRTDTALRHLASRLNLNDGDKAVLLKAAAVLSENGRKVGNQASKVKRDEDARDKAVAKAEQEAKAMIANWPATTTLDKVAICIANQMESNLLHDLQSESRDMQRSLDYWTELALREMPTSAAWRSVRDGKPVNELMALAQEKLEQIRTQPGTMSMAERWQAQMGVQAANNP
jgi:urease gamma subunit